MDLIRATSTEHDRMVKVELEAAEALAGLAHFPTTKSLSNGSNESVAERLKLDDCNSSFDTFPKCSINSYDQETTNFMVKGSEKSGISASKSVKDEQSSQLGLNPYPTISASSGRKSRQNLSQAEMEARKIRRVLANRESARQTIRRRQAVFEELTRKAVHLAWENENLKKEKDAASKQYDSLKTKNECLKAKMTRTINNETKETQEESITTNEPVISTSSTNSPFIIYNQQPFLPFVWPSSVQSSAGIVFPSHGPFSVSAAASNNLDTASCEGSSMTINASGTPLYLLPYHWLVTLPQTSNENHRPHSFSLNDKPRETSECQQFFPETATGRPITDPMRCEEQATEHSSKEVVGEIHQAPVVLR